MIIQQSLKLGTLDLSCLTERFFYIFSRIFFIVIEDLRIVLFLAPGQSHPDQAHQKQQRQPRVDEMSKVIHQDLAVQHQIRPLGA